VPNLGLPELLVILFIVVLIFGTAKLPQLGRGIGEGIKNFKDAVKSGNSAKDEAPTKDKS
jgi:sec-independent protein translocase protein TatA